MADTFEVAITDAGWTDLTGSFTSGFMTIWGDKDILYRQSDSGVPASTVLIGHRLNSTSDFINFLVESPDVVYGRSLAPSALVVVTPT